MPPALWTPLVQSKKVIVWLHSLLVQNIIYTKIKPEFLYKKIQNLVSSEGLCKRTFYNIVIRFVLIYHNFVFDNALCGGWRHHCVTQILIRNSPIFYGVLCFQDTQKSWSWRKDFIYSEAQMWNKSIEAYQAAETSILIWTLRF